MIFLFYTSTFWLLLLYSAATKMGTATKFYKSLNRRYSTIQNLRRNYFSNCLSKLKAFGRFRIVCNPLNSNNKCDYGNG